MKTLTLIIALILSIQFNHAQDTLKTQSISVTIDNVLSDNGKVLFALHNSDTFMKGSGLQSAERKIENGKVAITFKNVEPGEYAIMVVHDENNNNSMDFDSNGMPAESYGMSNNPMSFGPPQFNDAKFEITDEDLDIAIRF